MKNIQRVFVIIFLFFFAILNEGCEDSSEEYVPSDVIYTMGANRFGAIGNGTGEDVSSPYNIRGLRNIIQVEANGQVSLALASDGEVFGWGWNKYGQIGTGDDEEICGVPKQLTILPKIVKIACSENISLAIDNDGHVWIWGTIFGDDFRENTLFHSSTPNMLSLENIVDIDCGRFHCAAVSSNGEVYTWGRNAAGSLGDGTNDNSVVPQKISISNIKSVSLGNYHSLALSEDGTVYSWGYNLHGELGLGTQGGNGVTPVIVPDLNDIVEIDAGGNHNICLNASGNLWAWGENYNGQIGIGSDGNSVYSPLLISSISGVKMIDASGSTSIAVTNDDQFWAWGIYKSNSIGGGYSFYTALKPKKMDHLVNSKLIATGGFHYMVVKENLNTL